MSHISPIVSPVAQFAPDADPDVGLLRALARAYATGDYRYAGRFDEFSVAAHAAYERPGLLEALAAAGLEPRLTSKYGYLRPAAVGRVRRRLQALEGREIDGLKLVRDRIGWFEFEPGGRL